MEEAAGIDLAEQHDCHCHLVERSECLHLIPSLGVGRVWLMGTRRQEWPVVAECGSKHPDRVVMAFGTRRRANRVCIHPWFADGASEAWPATLLELTRLLQSHPTALVGEIGLDGSATHPDTKLKYDMHTQYRVFSDQWDLAVTHQRPVSIHAVGCYGKLESFFQHHLKDVPKDLSRKDRDRLKRDGIDPTTLPDPSTHPSLAAHWPPAVMLHSYSGSVESIRNILRYPDPVATRFYFSFSEFVNGRLAFEKLQERLRAVPDDRVLVESDWNDARAVDERVVKAIELVARAKGWSLEDAARRMAANALRFLGKVA
ncbi:hypothetical protein BC830DRAFT_1080578 [Chytriomyces sp. MP71]|nr:hypothetical protein BC830DRAFT_1080578 [Chytriomyces sp. MP71]